MQESTNVRILTEYVTKLTNEVHTILFVVELTNRCMVKTQLHNKYNIENYVFNFLFE